MIEPDNINTVYVIRLEAEPPKYRSEWVVNHNSNGDYYTMRDFVPSNMTRSQLKELGESLVELAGCIPEDIHCCDMWVDEDGLCYCSDCTESRRRMSGPIG